MDKKPNGFVNVEMAVDYMLVDEAFVLSRYYFLFDCHKLQEMREGLYFFHCFSYALTPVEAARAKRAIPTCLMSFPIWWQLAMESACGRPPQNLLELSSFQRFKSAFAMCSPDEALALSEYYYAVPPIPVLKWLWSNSLVYVRLQECKDFDELFAKWFKLLLIGDSAKNMAPASEEFLLQFLEGRSKTFSTSVLSDCIASCGSKAHCALLSVLIKDVKTLQPEHAKGVLQTKKRIEGLNVFARHGPAALDAALRAVDDSLLGLWLESPFRELALRSDRIGEYYATWLSRAITLKKEDLIAAYIANPPPSACTSQLATYVVAHDTGDTILHAVARKRRRDVLERLFPTPMQEVQGVAVMELKNKDGNTPLLIAAEQLDDRLFDDFVARGARTDASGRHGSVERTVNVVCSASTPQRQKDLKYHKKAILQSCGIETDVSKANKRLRAEVRTVTAERDMLRQENAALRQAAQPPQPMQQVPAVAAVEKHREEPPSQLKRKGSRWTDETSRFQK